MTLGMKALQEVGPEYPYFRFSKLHRDINCEKRNVVFHKKMLFRISCTSAYEKAQDNGCRKQKQRYIHFRTCIQLSSHTIDSFSIDTVIASNCSLVC